MLGKDKTLIKEDQTVKEEGPDVRAPYSSPELCVYGDIAKLTQTAGMAGVTDFGTAAGMMHSH